MRRSCSAFVALIVLVAAAPAFAQQTGSGVLPGTTPLSAGGTVTSPILFPDGSASAPSMSFSSAPTKGWFYNGTDVAFGDGGTQWLRLGANPGGIGLGPNNIQFGGTVGSNEFQLVRFGTNKLSFTGTFLAVGGTTSSFPALKQVGATVQFRKADDSAAADVSAGNLTFTAGLGATNLLASATAPSSPSSCGTSPTVPNNNGTLAFTVNVGTGGTASACTVTMPAATTGWVCSVVDITTQSSSVFLQKQTASTTTSVTFTNYNTAGAATAFASGDVVRLICTGY